MLILFNVGIQFSYYHLLKRLSFPHWIALAPSSMRRFISGLSIVYMSVFHCPGTSPAEKYWVMRYAFVCLSDSL